MENVFQNVRCSVFVAASILAFASKPQDFQFQMVHQIRLVGKTPFKGRLEVFYGEEWGTVCDDNFTPFGCELVCKQLGFWNGTCISIVSSDCLAKQNGDFELGTGRIWLDDVKCTGYELRLDECQHSPWGKINCFHEEDVGCVCTPHHDQCNTSRHRILALDGIHSSVGVVEVQDDEGVWGAVCDDHWDDFDAIVFCKCLGYKDTSSFRALSMGRPIPILASYRGAFLYDEVHCPHGNSFFTRNLWDCDTKTHRPSKCDIRSELALVQCENNGADLLGKEPDRINVSVLCDGINLTVCIQPLFEFDVHSAEVVLNPPCRGAELKGYDDDLGFCYHISLIHCPPLETNKVVEGLKNYCYDISLEVPNSLFFMGGLTKRGCCTLKKSSQVETIFPASHSSDVEEETKSFASTGVKPRLSIPCFQEDSSKLVKISEGDVVDRGSTIHCNIVADVWDDDLQLVVQSCKFFSVSEVDDAAHAFSYTFIEDKCVVTDLLNVKLFSGGKHFWGLSFYLPKFESVDKVSMTCDVFLCDVKRDGKELCDRSCNFSNFSPNITTNITNFSSVIHHSTSPIPLKEALKIVESDDLLSRPHLTDVNKFKDDIQFKHETEFILPQSQRRKRRRRSLGKHVIEVGNEVFILVKDTGVGPLILKTGLLITEKSRMRSIDNFLVLLQVSVFISTICLSVLIIRKYKRCIS